MKLLEPIIERRLENDVPDEREAIIDGVCGLLDANPENAWDLPYASDRYYKACEELLRGNYTERVLLYLPFRYLDGAPQDFRKTYIDTWHRLLHIYDARESFHLGDCFEPDARPNGKLEEVVKCAHLTPWLLKYHYVSPEDILKIIQENSDDLVLLQSFKDTWAYIEEQNLIDSEIVFDELIAKTARLPARVEWKPLYVSRKREEWLAERGKPVVLLTPWANLEGPFSNNLSSFTRELEEISAHIAPSEIVLVGGSRLKGYATTSSDWDIWDFGKMKRSTEAEPGNSDVAHVYLNYAWMAGKDVQWSELEKKANDVADIYFKAPDSATSIYSRRQTLKRIEQDLLQYRLLHKGFARFTGRNYQDGPLDMDGDCPFYDDDYRRLATKIFAKYVWL